GALVTKDELMTAVWPKTIVEDNALQAHITALRKALGDDAELLHTVHGLGYRLAAVPIVLSPAPEAVARDESVLALAHAPDLKRKRRYGALAALLFVLIPLAFYEFVHEPAQQAPKPAQAASPTGLSAALPARSIAVLPFNNFSGDAKEEYFS